MRFFTRLAGATAVLFFALPLFAQPNAEALKHARAGFDFESKKQYQYALFEYDTAMKLDRTYPYPVERIGGLYQLLKNYPLAVAFYERAIRMDSSFDVYNYYNLGLSFRIVEKHDSAVAALKEFLHRMQPVNQQDSAAMKDADWWIKFNLGCIVEKAKPKNTEEPLLIPELRSGYDDFAPSLTADGQTLYFTSRRQGTNTKEVIETNDFGEDLFVSHRDSIGKWTKPTTLGPPLNSLEDEGAASVSADGQTLYMSLCRRPDGAGDCDLYQSQLAGDQWTAPQNLARPLNSPEWDAQPSVTADGNSMYFSSRRAGSIEGSEDLFVSYRTTSGTWTPPQNLNEPVNTRFNERSPFISADGKTLYFSSNGHPGFGNHDLFMTRKLDDGTWSEPVNLGRPINSYGDDAFLTIPARGDKIIYSSQRANARGPLNLYEAQLPAEFRPGPVMLIAGTAYDKVTHKPVAATIEVNDLKTDQRVAVYHANMLTGKFYVTLGTGKMFGVTATADGYVHYSDNYTVPDTIPYRELVYNVPLQPLPSIVTKTPTPPNPNEKTIASLDTSNKKGKVSIDTSGKKGKPWRGPINKDSLLALKNGKQKPGETKQPQQPAIDTTLSATIELHNIFFDFNKATLRPESHTELRYLTELLKKYPRAKIEIEGHTDSVGTAGYNKRLSQDRADAVKDYLSAQGISAKRLSAVGFGSSQPKATNATEEGRQINRRTEFRFIK
jgi:outer membrane protein OmpA-like peptidoglycan-associated protein